MNSQNSKDQYPRNSDAMARTAGKSATAGGDRRGGNNSKPKAIGGASNSQNQVIIITFLTIIKLGLRKFKLQYNKKLANEPRVHCIFFKYLFQLYFENVQKDSISILEQNFLSMIKYEMKKSNSYCTKKRSYHSNNFIYSEHIIVSIYSQVRFKRAVDEGLLDDSSKNETKKRRGEKPKLKYSDVARIPGNIMVEVRASNPRVQLGQPDFVQLEHDLAMAYVKLPAPRPAEMPQIFQMGLSQGGLWVGAKNEFTHQFMLVHVPSFTPPPGTGWYSYQVFGPNNRPYKYFKTTVPVRFWGSREELESIIKAFHPTLAVQLLDGLGISREPHLRISAGMEDPEDIKGGYFPIVLELDECLGPALGKLGGILTILSATLRLVGGGIEKFISDHKEAELAETNAAIAAVEAAKAAETAESDFMDSTMEYEPSSTIPLAPPPPTNGQRGLIPPLPALTQMRPRTPPPPKN